MTLRLRLVIGLVVLVTAGLAVFGFSTYALYSNSEHDRLDERIRNAVPAAAAQLSDQAGFSAGPVGPGRAELLPVGTYAQLLGPGGRLLIEGTNTNSDDRPRLPDVISDPGGGGRLFTTGSSVGSGDWRVSISRLSVDGAQARQRLIVVVAVPTREVAESLRRLVLIEGLAAAVLLLILGLGSWMIVRRALRPLEQMATSTRSITAGALSQRVEIPEARSEVGQLGVALNTMLDELERAFAERDMTETRLRQFLADASHELRTPLTSIQGFAELFRLGAGHPDLDLAVVMRRIEQESGRMKVLVDDLMLLATLDEARPLDRSSADLAVLAADACSDARAIAPDRPLLLHAPASVVVAGSPDHLRQAIANLVMNAVRHTPAGTPIEVAARHDVGATGAVNGVVEVRDHGSGLTSAALAHAFDRFWQADPARVGAGSGLGLSIVASIAAEHGGSVEAANAVAGGAVFTLCIPSGCTPAGSQCPAGSRSV